MSYTALASPMNIGALTLKNRFVMTAMGSNFAEEDGRCGEKLKAYYEARAQGGCGLIILETTSIAHPAGCSMPNMVGVSGEQHLPDLTDLASRVQAHGCKIALQLNHSGKVSQEDVAAGRPLLVPSKPAKSSNDMMPLLTREELGNFIKMAGPDGKGPQYKVMEQSDIDALVTQFADAAKLTQRAGFDAIELHAGHGYVLSSFLSPATNKREDRYGGPIENRARLMIEVLKAIRSVVGEDFPILVRLDAFEYRISGGITTDDFIAAAKLAVAAGADAIDVSAYSNTQKGQAFTEAPLVHQENGYLAFAERAKRELNVPIMAVGRIETERAEQDIAAGRYDLLGLGRKIIADEQLPNKIIANQAEQVRPCIYCYICVSQIFINQPLCCAVNASVGREQEDLIATSNSEQHAVVVGGGPGGMESARLLAEAGWRVSLYEKEPQLGGTARIAALAYEPNGRLIDYLASEMARLGVSINTGTTVDLDSLAALNADAVVVACGADRTAPPINGQEQNHVFDGEEMRGLLLGGDDRGLKKLNPLYHFIVSTAQGLGLLRPIGLVRQFSKLWMPLGHRVVIVGGGLVGVELAEFLVERGRKVTVLNLDATLSPELSIVRRAKVILDLREHGCELYNRCEAITIERHQVHYTIKDERFSAAADNVIIALGANPNTAMAEQLASRGQRVVSVGDCDGIGYIDGAILSARQQVATLLAD